MNLKIQIYFKCLKIDSQSNEILSVINKKCYDFLIKNGYKVKTSTKSYISVDKKETSEYTINITLPDMFDTLFIKITKKIDLLVRCILAERLSLNYNEVVISQTRNIENQLVTHTITY